MNLFKCNDVSSSSEPKKRFCGCASNPTELFTAKCELQPSQTTFYERMKDWVELVAPSANRGNTRHQNNKVFLPKNENATNCTFSPDRPSGIIPDWPTKSGRTKEKVEEHCNNAIRNSPSGRICSIIPGFPFHHFVHQCITDIQVLFEFFLQCFDTFMHYQLYVQNLYLQSSTIKLDYYNMNCTLLA